jgi:hypothetical protein
MGIPQAVFVLCDNEISYLTCAPFTTGQHIPVAGYRQSQDQNANGPEGGFADAVDFHADL